MYCERTDWQLIVMTDRMLNSRADFMARALGQTAARPEPIRIG